MLCSDCQHGLEPHSIIENALVCKDCGLRHTCQGEPLAHEIRDSTGLSGQGHVLLIEPLSGGRPLDECSTIRVVAITGLRPSEGLVTLLDEGRLEISVPPPGGYFTAEP